MHAEITAVQSPPNKIPNNGLLFNVIRKNKESEEIIKKLTKYLDRGADINAADANDKCNTPLHIAVLNSELQVVKFLLGRGANDTIKNRDGQTALDIAQLLNSSDGYKIVSILKNNQNGSQVQSKIQNTSDVHSKKEQLEQRLDHYQKRKGTAGIAGHLYETKLLSLILLRALYDNDIKEFYLASNVAGLGAFDDIVFRYKRHGIQKPKIVFLQAKHKDDPTKDKVTYKKIMKVNGDYSSHKYLESYRELIQKFYSSNENELFKGSLENIDCDFIVYTPAMANISKKMVIQKTDVENYIETSESGKIFKFNADNEDIEVLSNIFVKSRAVELAKRLTRFIIEEDSVNMMADDMIKLYHVFLAQNIISLQAQDNKLNRTDIDGNFRKTFLNTNDDLLLLMKNTIFKELEAFKGNILNDKENKLKAFSFKVPAEFGNVRFHIKENYINKQDRINYLCTIFDKLFLKSHQNDSNYIVEINESDIGLDNILKPMDIESSMLGGLVGNLLIYDQYTKMLKFNLPELLSDDSLNLLKQLKNNDRNLSQYRFNIKIKAFPKLTLEEEDDKIQVREFLSKFKFYTNQAKEDQVEIILKNKIDEINCNTKHDSLFQVKRDAIFLKFHDAIQKWWKHPDEQRPCLTKKCQFYYEAKRDILNSPLLNILNYTFCKKMENNGIKFTSHAITALQIADFLKDDAKIMVVASDEIQFTSIKFIQYFREQKYSNIIFLDLECLLSEIYLETIEKELIDATCCVLVLIYQIGITSKFQITFDAVKKAFKGKIIIITSDNNASKNLKDNITDKIISQFDNYNNFRDLESEVQGMILEERELIFQGEKIPINAIFDTKLLQAVKPNTILRIVNNETIVIGKTLTSDCYKKTVDFYINQNLCRYITLNTRNKENYTDLYFINDADPADIKSQGYCDIILITEELEKFQRICNENKDRNVHWFSREINGGNNIWLKSKGNLETLIKYINKDFHIDYLRPPEKLIIEEKLIIISGEPGLGKSTLLTHIAVHTKKQYPTLWVSKINFLDRNNIQQFSRWKKDKTNINLVEAFKFLYGAIDIKALEGEAEASKSILEKIGNRMVINDVNEICLNNVDGTVDLIDIHLFNHCYNNNQVVLLFDGFDEICPDFANEVIQLLCTLKSSKVAHLWVTTRPYNVLNQLQCALGTFSFTLQSLTWQEQKLCLQKVWSKELCLDSEMYATKISEIVSGFFNKIRYALGNNKSFMGMPLHIHMIAETFKSFFEDEFHIPEVISYEPYEDALMMTLNLCTLYEKFIDKKFFSIRFGSKKSSLSFEDPDLRNILEKVHKAYLDSHKKISAYTLLNKSIVMKLFSKEDIQDVNDFIETVKLGEEKSGIIECIIGDDPKFVHLTFAEYFSMEFVCDKLKSGSCTTSICESLIKEIFVTDKMGIRRFINSKLCKNQDLLDLTLYTNYTDTIKEILSSQSCLLFTSFNVAIEENLEDVAIFLLKCARTTLNKENLDIVIKLFHKKSGGLCLFCTAVSRNRSNILNYLLDLIKEIDGEKIKNIFYCPDNPLMIACEKRFIMDDRALPVLMDALQSNSNNLLVDLLTWHHFDGSPTAAHVLGINGNLFYFRQWFYNLTPDQFLKIFSVTDSNGKQPSHYAAENNHNDFSKEIDNMYLFLIELNSK